MREIVDGYLINDDNIKIAFTNRNVDAKNSEDMKNFSAKYGFNHNNIVYNTQVHGADVRIVESEDDVAEKMQTSTKAHLKDMTIKFLENIKYNKRG